jgi:hypothetical protein
VAGIPLNLTAVVSDKFVPVIVTSSPTGLELGENELIVGEGIKVNGVAEVTVPTGVVIEIGPVVVKGTTAVTVVELITLKLAA